ncbi:MAG: phosphotransferase, partial [Bacteroidetes bacterium]|nr:phosphotransferase [Bacteroidota bacterium]
MSNQTLSNPAPVEKQGIPGRPGLSVADAEILASKQYGLIGSATPLPSYSDQNFLFEIKSGKRFVLKIFNSLEEPAFLEAQQHALLRLEEAGLPVPRVVPTCDGAESTHLELDASGRHLVRMVTWLDGQVLAEVRPQSTQLLEALGKTLGEMDSALRDFDHPSMYRRLDWDLVHASDTIRTRLRYLASSDQRTLVEE